MANSYSYKIHQLDAKINQDGKSNVIYHIHYNYSGVNDDDNSKQYSINNIVHLDTPGDDFIEYDNITKEQVVQWIESKINVEDFKNAIDKEIEKQINPTDIHLHPNWDNQNINI